MSAATAIMVQTHQSTHSAAVREPLNQGPPNLTEATRRSHSSCHMTYDSRPVTPTSIARAPRASRGTIGGITYRKITESRASPGGRSGAAPPGPIPNPEVKRPCADGSVATGHVRVGRRQGIPSPSREEGRTPRSGAAERQLRAGFFRAVGARPRPGDR